MKRMLNYEQAQGFLKALLQARGPHRSAEKVKGLRRQEYTFSQRTSPICAQGRNLEKKTFLLERLTFGDFLSGCIAPFTPKFLQINSPPGFFFVIFFVIFTGIRWGHRFFL